MVLYPAVEQTNVSSLVRENVNLPSLSLKVTFFRLMRDNRGFVVAFEDVESRQHFNGKLEKNHMLRSGPKMYLLEIMRPHTWFMELDGMAHSDTWRLRDPIRLQNSQLVLDDPELTVDSTFVYKLSLT